MQSIPEVTAIASEVLATPLPILLCVIALAAMGLVGFALYVVLKLGQKWSS